MVEGKDECNFFSEIVEKERLLIQIEDYKGKANLKNYLESLKKRTGHETITSIGIEQDADNDPDAAYDSICHALKSASYPGPDQEKKNRNEIKVTILIIPDRDKKGMLEDICLSSIKDDPHMSCVEAYMNCIREKTDNFHDLHINQAKTKIRSFLISREIIESAVYEKLQKAIQEYEWPENIASAKIHSFIASKPKPYLELGSAIKAGYFDLNHRAFEKIISFLKKL
ncbi:MAG: hypothetical protein JW881_09120 [Spirochaetales bacterium]|nr:hypothetical protein [Spirochaetales bacterium]